MCASTMQKCRSAIKKVKLYTIQLWQEKETTDEAREKLNVVLFHLISFLSAVSEVCTEIRGTDFMQ